MPFFARKAPRLTGTQWNAPGDHAAVTDQGKTTVDGQVVGWIETPTGGMIVKPTDWIMETPEHTFFVVENARKISDYNIVD